jgi:5-methylcytosine-specific restriction endonuclease McrA
MSDKTRKKRAAYRVVCKEVDDRDQGRCLLCGRQASDHHHILYRSQGGADIRDNLASLCRSCHDRVHLTGSPSVWRPILWDLVVGAEDRARREVRAVTR